MVIVTPDGREFRFSDDISEAQAQAIVKATLAAEASGRSAQAKEKELAATSSALLAAQESAAAAQSQIAALNAKVDSLSSYEGEAKKAQEQIAALNAKVEALANARPTIVAKAAPIVDNSAAVVAAVSALEKVMQAGFDRLFKAQMADTVLRPDEFGEFNRSVKVIK